jgi:aldehyde dehydrogenase (NAD+)
MQEYPELIETESAELERLFKLQQENQYKVGNTTARERKAKLKKFHEVFLNHREQIKEALFKDFGKHPSEVDLSEIYPVTSEIKHARHNMNKWLGKNPRPTPLALLGASSRIKYEPKGVVLIISPWNFPVNLTFGPLVSAIAAGNCVIIKPSEMTPYASAVMKKIVQEVFDENEVAVVEGSVKTAQPLLELPFNHIFFTGAPSIGKIIMGAAAKNLASVTLELGGKSPTIVDETADVKMAAKRVAWGKFLNNGQVCIAPDYLLVHESKKEAFIKEIKDTVKSFYTEDASRESSYNRIVNNRHYNRLKDVMEDAFNNGANIVEGGKFNEDDNYISPTILTDMSMDSKVMNDEIFGPILPVIPYSTIDEAIKIIQSKEKPLALYIYSKSNKNIDKILKNTRAGGSCINHNAIHFFNLDLGFGGSNNSGIGRGHGDEGFKAFSNARGVMRQHIPNALDLLMPPYNDFKQKLIDLTIKWF